MRNASISISSAQFITLYHIHGAGYFLNKLINFSSHEQKQIDAWSYQIDDIYKICKKFPKSYVCLEFPIPRMGGRIDLILICEHIIFVIEYKVNSTHFNKSDTEQVYSYALDLKNFHSTSKHAYIVPILVATNANIASISPLVWGDDYLAQPMHCSFHTLIKTITYILDNTQKNHITISPHDWEKGSYQPTPTIIEATRALYNNHNIEEISRSEAGAENISRTSVYISDVIRKAQEEKQKVICFVTGVPGSGKTLVGLNISTNNEINKDNHATFLSGNSPLIKVLQEALYNDIVKKSKVDKTINTTKSKRNIISLIQNIHHFRDNSFRDKNKPSEHITIFDEAQRSWNKEQTTKFLKEKSRSNISLEHYLNKSEPEILLDYMNRHQDWCAVICLIGQDQEINKGETGLKGWLDTLYDKFPEWHVHLASCFKQALHIPQTSHVFFSEDLYLSTSIRSFRAENLADFIHNILSNDHQSANNSQKKLEKYPLFITRDLEKARHWLRNKKRGNEHIAILASSNAMRLKPHGIFVKSEVDPAKWFLSPSYDIRSSDMLEDVGTEFLVQGLEVDWACVCWDLNMKRTASQNNNNLLITPQWTFQKFRGTKWQNVKQEESQKHIENAYRVLLTRARQGLVIFIPPGSIFDETRPPSDYDAIYNFLLECGFTPLPTTP